MTDLKSGILFEDTNQFLPWGTSLHKLVTKTESKIRKESDRIIIDWGEHQLLNGLKLHLTSSYLTPIIPLFLRKFKTIDSEITGDTAAKLGFEKISDGVPNYWYVEPNIVKRIHRFTLRKTKTDNQELTEYQNRTAQGFTRVWDCGSSKWEWPNQLTA